ncbi:zinc finger protein 26 isoform X1 [Folsomia candida]|uniref:Zinc finger protein ZIC 1 n=1 Tax=Folsomia candida TaxID=158441 RepID=A0A226ECM2_FOLCA|nr:zinc finger protein 26 isoform X1 [Folsomia candida]XP_021952918.1 zinc finger protein 26 isoform X1 [Folsomia candida]OXA54501.1 Zinc finger protein ZIC 1 [Folsomia candida]
MMEEDPVKIEGDAIAGGYDEVDIEEGVKVENSTEDGQFDAIQSSMWNQFPTNATQLVEDKPNNLQFTMSFNENSNDEEDDPVGPDPLAGVGYVPVPVSKGASSSAPPKSSKKSKGGKRGKIIFTPFATMVNKFQREKTKFDKYKGLPPIRWSTTRTKFTCLRCGKVLNQKESYIAHMESHKIKFKCEWPGCSSYFYSENSHRAHVHSSHTKRPFSCAMCFQAFSSKAWLAIHEEFNHNVVDLTT